MPDYDRLPQAENTLPVDPDAPELPLDERPTPTGRRRARQYAPATMSDSPRNITARETARNCLTDRKAGLSLYEIGDKYGIKPQNVHRIIQREIRRLNNICQETRDELVRMEVERCDALFAALYPQRHQARITEVLLKVLDRRAKYYGLDAPLKIQQDITVDDLTDDQLRDAALQIGLEVAQFSSSDSLLPGELPRLEARPSSEIVSLQVPLDIALPVHPSPPEN